MYVYTVYRLQLYQSYAEADSRTDGQRSIELLTNKLGFNTLPKGTTFQRPGVRFESYPGMGHSSSDREIRDLKEWLTECLKD